MFDHCSNFTITGSSFNISHNPCPSAPDEGATPVLSGCQCDDLIPEFRFIRRGDINLLSYVGENEIVEYRAVRRKGRSGTVRVVTGTRETYHARIFPSQDTFTVVKYNGSSFTKVGLLFFWFRFMYAYHLYLVENRHGGTTTVVMVC